MLRFTPAFVLILLFPLLPAQALRMRPDAIAGSYDLGSSRELPAGDRLRLDVQVLSTQPQLERLQIGFALYGSKSRKQLRSQAKDVVCSTKNLGMDGLEYSCQWAGPTRKVAARGGSIDIPSYEVMRIRATAGGAIEVAGGVPGAPDQWKYTGRRAANK